jgi:drug/metabolite transporter (DMT)-like permease
MTLNYMSSVWIAAFLVGGALFTWNPRAGAALPARQGPLALTVLAGFVGVVLMLRPTIEQHQVFAGLVGLLSGLLSAFAYLQVMALGRIGEPEVRTVFYFAAGSALAGGAGMLVTGVSAWDWGHALWLLPMAVLASLGQWCMTRAYSHGATLVVANLQYSGIVFGALYSLALFGDRIPLAGWAGMALICASGIAGTVLRARAAPDAPAEGH